MTDQHPIVPSFEIANQWHKEACKDPYNGGKFIDSKTLKYIATKAAQWGANQELEACCEWFQEEYKTTSWGTRDLKHLRNNRRPKLPSLKEQALALLNDYIDPDGIISRALDALPND